MFSGQYFGRDGQGHPVPWSVATAIKESDLSTAESLRRCIPALQSVSMQEDFRNLPEIRELRRELDFSYGPVQSKNDDELTEEEVSSLRNSARAIAVAMGALLSSKDDRNQEVTAPPTAPSTSDLIDVSEEHEVVGKDVAIEEDRKSGK